MINDVTVLLATRALKNHHITKLSTWPGVSFSADSDEGKVLIGMYFSLPPFFFSSLLTSLPLSFVLAFPKKSHSKSLIHEQPGSPTGATIAHLLIAHKAHLGIKRIARITLVTNESRRARFGEHPVPDMHIFYEIEDVRGDDDGDALLDMLDIQDLETRMGEDDIERRKGGVVIRVHYL